MNFESILQNAVQDLKQKERIYHMVDPNFQDIAYLEMQAADLRVKAIVKEVKQNEGNYIQEQC